MSRDIFQALETAVLDRQRVEVGGQDRRILKKITERLTKSINVDEWNYYHRIAGTADKKAAMECRAIRFTGRNLSAITQPTGIHARPDSSAGVAGSIHFGRTSRCPAKKLALGEYLSWDGKCFTVRDEQQFHSIYKHQ